MPAAYSDLDSLDIRDAVFRLSESFLTASRISSESVLGGGFDSGVNECGVNACGVFRSGFAGYSRCRFQVVRKLLDRIANIQRIRAWRWVRLRRKRLRCECLRRIPIWIRWIFAMPFSGCPKAS